MSTLSSRAIRYVLALGREDQTEKDVAYELEQLKEAVQRHLSTPYLDEVRAYADEHYSKEGEIEFDDDAVVSWSDSGGAYVEGWIYVEGDEIERMNPEFEEDGDDGTP